MQMIDVMKRLAEIDSANIVKENAVAECGIMPEMNMSPSHPPMPASINMTAGSGEELSDMLTTIMSLAGIHKVEPEHLGVDQEPMQLTPEPGMAVGPASAGDDMRAVLDKLNPENDGEEEPNDKEETEESGRIPGVATTPNDTQPKQPFGANQFANQENQPGQGDRMDGNMPKGNAEKKESYADMNEAVADLFAQYKKFVNE
jgi:hypothetical protein